MGWVIDLLSGWGGFFTLLFRGDVVLMIVAGVGFAMVMVAAMRARIHMATRRFVMVVSTVIFGLILAYALGFLD